MAQIFYVASSGGNDNNSGSSEGSPKVSGTGAATIVGATVTLLADNPDLSTVVVGDTIRLANRTDGYGGFSQNDIFVVTAVDDALKTVDVTPAPNSITSGVTWAIGGAFSTLRRAAAFVHPLDKCYVKGSFTGRQDMTDVGYGGGTPTTPVTIEGYATASGDGGTAVFDGQNAEGHGLWIRGISVTLFWIIKNIRVTRYTTAGFDDTYAGYPMQYVNCEADHCAKGWVSGALCNFINCYAHDNSVAGFDCHDHNEFYACVIRDNAKGILADSGVRTHRCLLYNNTTHNIHVTGAFTSDPTIIADTTIDGNGVSDYGVFGYQSSYSGGTKFLNSMVINCGVGVHVSGDDGLWNVNAGLLVHGNDVDFENYAGQNGLVTGKPTFVNEGVDWTPAAGSAAIAAGFDLRTNQSATVTGALPTIGGLDPVAASTVTAHKLRIGA